MKVIDVTQNLQRSIPLIITAHAALGVTAKLT